MLKYIYGFWRIFNKKTSLYRLHMWRMTCGIYVCSEKFYWWKYGLFQTAFDTITVPIQNNHALLLQKLSSKFSLKLCVEITPIAGLIAKSPYLIKMFSKQLLITEESS